MWGQRGPGCAECCQKQAVSEGKGWGWRNGPQTMWWMFLDSRNAARTKPYSALRGTQELNMRISSERFLDPDADYSCSELMRWWYAWINVWIWKSWERNIWSSLENWTLVLTAASTLRWTLTESRDGCPAANFAHSFQLGELNWLLAKLWKPMWNPYDTCKPKIS